MRTESPERAADQDGGPMGDEEAPETGPVADEKGADEKGPRTRAVGPLGWVALAVALLLGASGGFAWWSAAHDDDLATGRSRDAVLVTATHDIAVLNTLDYRSIAKGLRAWRSVSTGTLQDQFAGISEKDQQVLADQRKISVGKVVDAAVIDLDGSSATVVAAVEVTVKDGADASADPVVKRNRFSAELTRTGGTWKVANLQQVAVNVS